MKNKILIILKAYCKNIFILLETIHVKKIIFEVHTIVITQITECQFDTKVVKET